MTASLTEYLQYRKDRSDEVFRDAILLAENGSWRSCINRLYYSLFHLVTGLLSLDGITTKTHEGLKTKFLQLYVKTNIIDVAHGKLFSQLMDWRQESDYSVIVDFQKMDVLPLIEQVRNMNEVLIKLIHAKIEPKP
jgi:uncharacterized protein (UPF0332 family)